MIETETSSQLRGRLGVRLGPGRLALHDGPDQLDHHFPAPVDVLGVLVGWLGPGRRDVQEGHFSSLVVLVAMCEAVEVGEVAEEVASIVGDLEVVIDVLPSHLVLASRAISLPVGPHAPANASPSVA